MRKGKLHGGERRKRIPKLKKCRLKTVARGIRKERPGEERS